MSFSGQLAKLPKVGVVLAVVGACALAYVTFSSQSISTLPAKLNNEGISTDRVRITEAHEILVCDQRSHWSDPSTGGDGATCIDDTGNNAWKAYSDVIPDGRTLDTLVYSGGDVLITWK